MIHFDPFPLGHFKVDWLKLGGMVKDMRKANHLTLREAADLTGISAATIMRAERGYSVEPDHFFTLLQFVGIPFDLRESICKR